jgi:hypothetical protein
MIFTISSLIVLAGCMRTGWLTVAEGEGGWPAVAEGEGGCANSVDAASRSQARCGIRI